MTPTRAILAATACAFAAWAVTATDPWLQVGFAFLTFVAAAGAKCARKES